MQLVIDTTNTKISVENKIFVIKNDTTKRKISPKKISSIAITSNCLIHASAIKLAAFNQIPIFFYNNFGTLQARTWSPYFVNMASFRQKQMKFVNSKEAGDWIKQIYLKKSYRQVANIKWLNNRKPRFKPQTENHLKDMQKIIEKISGLDNNNLKTLKKSLLGYEGNISKVYFKALNIFMPEEFHFTKRSRRPATDFFNALLNYIYGMTYSVVESGIFAKGMDPFIGIMHADIYNRPTLVYDLIEPFRPVMDKMIIQQILKGNILPEHFIKKEQGYWISKKGKRIIIPGFNNYINRRIQLEHANRRLIDHIYYESNLLGNVIKNVEL